MPRSDFYAELPLAEQLEKLADHHADPKVRHISHDEATIIHHAAARLRRRVSERERVREFDQIWQQLGHLYTTTVVSSSTTLRLMAVSVPAHGRAVPDRPSTQLFGLRVVGSATASPRTAQIGLNLLIRHDRDPRLEMSEAWRSVNERRSPPFGVSIETAEHELLNRVLYQPTVVIERSPPVVSSLANILDQGDGWIALAIDEAGGPLAVVGWSSGILAFTVLRLGAGGLGEGLRERLYEWARPERDDEQSS